MQKEKEKVVDDSDDEDVVYQPKIDCLDDKAEEKRVSEKGESSDDDGPQLL